jgi:hypothetical protein
MEEGLGEEAFSQHEALLNFCFCHPWMLLPKPEGVLKSRDVSSTKMDIPSANGKGPTRI